MQTLSTDVIFWDLPPGTGENGTKNIEKKKVRWSQGSMLEVVGMFLIKLEN